MVLVLIAAHGRLAIGPDMLGYSQVLVSFFLLEGQILYLFKG